MIPAGERDHYGGEPGRLERRAAYDQRVSDHRRDARLRHLKAHRLRLLIFALIAFPGAVILVHEMFQWTPNGLLILTGILMVLPFLTELGEN